MKMFRVLFLVLVLSAFGCRTVPQNVADSHNTTMVESEAAFEVANDVLEKIGNQSAVLDNEFVQDSFEEWKEHHTNLLEARKIVLHYLRTTDTKLEVTNAYRVGADLLSAMNDGFEQISVFWEDMVKDENKIRAEEFIRLFRKDIDRYRTLERKFDEWISQFRVKE